MDRAARWRRIQSMKAKYRCYLRPYRRRWGLTQKELATLVGMRAASVISRIERGDRSPSLAMVVACQILFGVSVVEIFPALYDGLEEEVVTRSYALYDELQGISSRVNTSKLDFFEQVFARAKSRASKL